MPNPVTGFKNSNNVDFGNILITKEYLMSVYPQIANQLITPDLWTWGQNFGGKLGDTTTTNRSTPVTTFAGGTDWKQVSCGQNNTVAIKTDGTLWVWGQNTSAELGNNSTAQSNTPITTFAGGTNWKQVSCGGYCMAAIKTDGTLWTWGANGDGRLGTFDNINRSTPVTTFAGGTNWKQVACTNGHMAAIKTDGTLWIWGSGNFGQLGNLFNNNSNTPITTLAGGTNWKQVSTGFGFVAAIKTDGTLWTWGRNLQGQLGNNTFSSTNTPITTFAGGTNWKQVSTGFTFATAIKTDGTLWAWGEGSNGQMGNADTTTRIVPVTTFLGGTNWKQVAGGGYHISAIKTDGTLWTWGAGGFGQLATFDSSQRSTPVTTFLGGTNWKQVAGGIRHTAAIRTSDDLQGI